MATVPDRSGNSPVGIGVDRTISTPSDAGRTDAFEYMYNNNTVDLPPTGVFRVNTDPPTGATLFRIYNKSITGVSTGLPIRTRALSGKTIAIHEKDNSDNYILYTIKSSPAVVEANNCFEIPVQLRDTRGVLPQQRCMVAIV